MFNAWKLKRIVVFWKSLACHGACPGNKLEDT